MTALKVVEDKRVEYFCLTMATRWFRARAESLLQWARLVERIVRGDETPIDRPDKAIAELEKTESDLARYEPTTVAGAVGMLKVAIAILEQRRQSDEVLLGDGPALDILINARKGLDELDRDMPLKLKFN